MATATRSKLTTKVKLDHKEDLGDGKTSKTFSVMNMSDESIIGYVIELHQDKERVALQAVMNDKAKTTITEDKNGQPFSTRARTVTAVRRAFLGKS